MPLVVIIVDTHNSATMNTRPSLSRDAAYECHAATVCLWSWVDSSSTDR